MAHLYPNDPIRQRVHDRAVKATLGTLEDEGVLRYEPAKKCWRVFNGAVIIPEELLIKGIEDRALHGN